MLNGHAGATTANSSTMPSHKLPSFSSQLKTLLWKNWILKKRSPWTLIAEIVVPVFLFVLLAWVRTRRPAEIVPTTSYNSLALPSTGVFSMAQGLLCDGVDLTIMTPSRKSALEQVIDVLEQRELSFTSIQQTLLRTAADLDALEQLSSMNLTGIYLIQDLIKQAGLPFSDDLRELSQFNSSQLGLNQVSVDLVCESAQNVSSFWKRRIRSQNIGNVAAEIFGINVTRETQDLSWVTSRLLNTFFQSETFINTSLPAFFLALNDIDPDTFPFSQSKISDIQSALEGATLEETELEDILEELKQILQYSAGISPTVIAELFLAENFKDPVFLASLIARVLIRKDTLTPKEVNELEDVFAQVNSDIHQLDDIASAVSEIVAIPEISQILQLTTDDLGDTIKLWQDLLCPVTETQAIGGSLRFRRSGGEDKVAESDAVSVPNLRNYKSIKSRQLLTRTMTINPSKEKETSAQSKPGHKRQRKDGEPIRLNPDTATNINQLLQLLKQGSIYYTPDVPAVRNVIRHANESLQQLNLLGKTIDCLLNAYRSTIATPTADSATATTNSAISQQYLNRKNDSTKYVEPFANLLNRNIWRGFSDEQALITAATGPENIFSVFGGVVFRNITQDGTLPDNLTISLRFHQLKVPRTDKTQPSVTWNNDGNIYNQFYYYFGFLFLQDLLEDAYIKNRIYGDTIPSLPLVFAQNFPVPAHRDDLFAWGISRSLPLFMVLSWIYSVSRLAKNIVYEKELQLKEYLKIMGLHDVAHSFGWFTTYLVIMSASVILMTIVLCAGNVLSFSDPFLIFLYLELSAISSILLAFLFASFFTRAKIAAALSGMLYFGTYMPYAFISIREESVSATTKWGSSIFSTTAFGIAASYIARLEEAGIGIQWHNITKSIIPCDDYTFANAMLMMAFDCIFYMLLSWYINNIFPGYGIPQPWHFPFHADYWLSCLRSDLAAPIAQNGNFVNNHSSLIEPLHSLDHVGIRLDHVTKVYSSDKSCRKGSNYVALSNLSLCAPANAITALLGHNGAGKTTTISIITGIFPPSSGAVFVHNRNVQTDIAAIRQTLGVCPQRNILFDGLTVEEHLLLCGRLRCIPPNDHQEIIEQHLRDIGLIDKRDCLTSTLSGGQKRKLCVIMAFLCGRETVILDEPTAGMDPSARRATWNLLLRYKLSRTILLCTHHLDEADLLSDRVCILSNGKLQCAGSPMFLKRIFNTSYVLTCEIDRAFASSNGLLQAVATVVPGASIIDDIGHEISISLPRSTTCHYSKLCAYITSHQSELGVIAYGINATSLEDVFLQVVTGSVEDDMPPEFRKDDVVDDPFSDLHENSFDVDTVNLVPSKSSQRFSRKTSKLISEKLSTKRKETLGFCSLLPCCLSSNTSNSMSAPVSNTGIYTGVPVTGMQRKFQQLRALLTKRMLNAKRDKKAFISQIILPAIFVVLGMLVAISFPPVGDMPPLLLTPATFQQPCASGNIPVITPFSDTANSSQSARLTEAIGQGSLSSFNFRDISLDETFVSNDRNMTSYILNTYKDLQRTRRAALSVEQTSNPLVVASAYALPNAALSFQTRFKSLEMPITIMRAWFDNRHYHSLPISVHLAHTTLLHAYAGNRYNLYVENHPLNATVEEKAQAYLESATDLTVAINVILALSFVPASFVVFLISERVSKTKHLQIMSGLDILTYWTGNAIWDMINFLFPACVSLIIFAIFDIPAYTGRNFSAVAVLLLLYGWSITPLMYNLESFFKVPSTGYIVLICTNLFVGLTATLATFILDLFADDKELRTINNVLKWAFLIFPNYCLGRGLMDIAANEYLTQVYEMAAYVVEDAPGFKSPFSIDLVGRNMIVMFFEGIVFFAIRVGWELKTTHRKKMSPTQEISLSETKEIEEDVRHERDDVHNHLQQYIKDQALVVKDISKVYRSRKMSKQAVNSFSLAFRVPRGECFGLLGVNGAGKTSTFKMLTGDESISTGHAWISGYSVVNQLREARQHVGYCSQADALLDLLTGREMLTLCCRLRGIVEEDIPTICAWAIYKMQLTKWADRPTKMYSGGNKRKLSVALALLGTNDVVMLDEPTAGMDPCARRFLWNRISDVVHDGRSVILTSHAMDECQALCHRIGIMVNGEFKCLGTPQHLKSKYGNGYVLAVKVRGFPPQVEHVVEAVSHYFSDAEVSECHNGFVRFQIPRETVENVSLAKCFLIFDKIFAEHAVEDYSFSQTSLEQVFCKFVESTPQPDTDTTYDLDTSSFSATPKIAQGVMYVNKVFEESTEEDTANGSCGKMDKEVEYLSVIP